MKAPITCKWHQLTPVGCRSPAQIHYWILDIFYGYRTVVTSGDKHKLVIIGEIDVVTELESRLFKLIHPAPKPWLRDKHGSCLSDMTRKWLIVLEIPLRHQRQITSQRQVNRVSCERFSLELLYLRDGLIFTPNLLVKPLIMWQCSFRGHVRLEFL